MTADDMVVSLESGEVVEGNKALVGYPTHRLLYQAFPTLRRAYPFAPRHHLGAGRAIIPRPALPMPTTLWPVPCTRLMTDAEINGDYGKPAT